MNTDYIDRATATTWRWNTLARLEIETMSVYAYDGSTLILLVVAVAVIGLAVWAVSKLFPVSPRRPK
jgi:hypothetical protein